MLVALGVPPLSIASQLYQPARPAPICAIHGHTRSRGASIVIACVEAKSGAGTSASTGSGRRFSRAVAMQVAPTITLWKEHLLYLHPRPQIAPNRRRLPAIRHSTPIHCRKVLTTVCSTGTGTGARPGWAIG